MAPRANWKGYLKLSLVSCAVNLYPASSTSSRVSFNTINRKTGNKVKRQFVDAETGEVVENEDQAKGYPVAKDSYLLVSDDELDKIQIESSHTIEIEKFVPRARSTPGTMTRPITSRRASASLRRLSRSSGTPCATKRWSAWAGS